MRRLAVLKCLVVTALLTLGAVSLVELPLRANLLQGSAAPPPPPPTGNCTQSTNFFARVWALPATLDGTVGASVGTGTLHLGAYDALICNLQTDGIWSTLDAMWILATQAATGSSTAVANLNLVSSNYTLTATGSPAFTANNGYTGGSDGNSTVYLDTHYAPATNGVQFTPTSAHFSAWILNDFQTTSSTPARAIGVSSATQQNYIIPHYLSGVYCSTNTNGTPVIGTLPTFPASIVCLGVPTFGWTTVNGNVGSGLSITPQSAFPAGDFYILSGNNQGTPLGGPWQVAVVTIGATLSGTQVSSSGALTGTGLVPRICNYLTAVKGSCP